jgi:hypothetical protein
MAIIPAFYSNAGVSGGISLAVPSTHWFFN